MPAELASTAPVLSDWLHQLSGLLEPLQPQRLALVSGLVLPLRMQWLSRLPDDVQPVEPEAPLPPGLGGWLVQLEASGPEPLLLFIAARKQVELPEAVLSLVATLVRAAWRLRRARFDEINAADDTAEAIHALRNSLNSVLMSAAVITTCADLLPERLQPIAREIEAAAARSVQRLHHLTGLIESRA